MKKTLITSLLATCTMLNAAEEDYLTSIWQINTFYDENGKKQVVDKKLLDLPSSGTQEAAQGIMGTSEFFLYAEDVTTGEEHLLDSTSASAYKHDAVLTITGPEADPYNLNLKDGEIPRTQVGQGFTVTYTVNGLIEDESESEASRKLDFFRELYQFSADQTALGSEQSPNSSSTGEIDENGHYVYNNVQTKLPSADSTQTRGLERFVIASRDDYRVKGAVIDSASIHVWPISNGSFSGIQSGATYRDVPTVNVSLIDLYPSSDTYLEISSSVLEEPLIYGSRKNTDDVPISVDYNLTSLNEALEKDGVYTIRLLHVSPFDTLEFGSVTFTVRRTINIDGSITDSEK